MNLLDDWLSTKRVTKTDSCWIWGQHTSKGRPKVKYKTGTYYADRLAYSLKHNQEIHPNERLIKTCKESLCINPDHHVIILNPLYVAPRIKSEIESFEAHVTKTDSCWIWKGQVKSGYGRFEYKNRRVAAHRASYRIYNKQDPGELFVCHKCDNPICVNPNHLFLGTAKDNMQDALKKGRLSTRKDSVRKLSVNEASMIKSLIHNQTSLTQIAKIFNVSNILIRRIRDNYLWKDAPLLRGYPPHRT